MRVLIGCECSGRIRSAFRNLGHDAWSCDLKPAEDGSRYHLQCDVLTVLDRGWDLGIFHPDCTYLANSGVRWLSKGGRINRERWKKMVKAIEFFNTLLKADIPKISLENPVMHLYARRRIIRPFTQSIQPWQFGDPECKRTCLWLKNLNPLQPTCRVPKKLRKQTVAKEPPGPERKANRSRTFPGIAKAMAVQWGRQQGLIY